DFDAAAAQRDSIKSVQHTLYARGEELARQMRDCDVEAEQLRARQSSLEGESNERESSIAVLKSQVQSNTESADRLQRELDQQEGRADSIAAQIAQREERLREIAGQRQTLEDELAARHLEEAENRRQAGTLAEELEALRSSEQIQNASLADAKELLSALAASGQEMIDRDTSLRASIQENQEKLAQTEAEARAKRKELNDTKDQRDSLENVIAGYQMKASSRSQKLEAAQDRVNQLTLDSNNLSGRIHMLTEMEKLYEGYSKAVKAVMQAAERKQLRGIHGPVASLMKVPEQYTVAIETALGAAQQNLVVDREEDGKAAINYLKRRDAGRATFLPLSAVRANYLKERNVEQCRGFVGVASALVTCEGQYADVVGNLLGRVVIAEDMDAAIAMARQFGHRFRIVTLDGQVLNPGGSMTGGSTSRSAGILSRASELERLEKQSAQLKEDMDEARRALADAKREADQANYEMEVARNQKRTLDDTVLRLDGEYGQCRILLGALRDNRDNWQDELESLRQRARKLEEDTEAARQRIESLEDSAAALRTEAAGKAAGQDVFRKQAEAIAAAIAEVHVAQASLDAEQSATLTALEELKAMERDITGDRESRRRQIAEYGQRNEELTGRIRALEEGLQTLRASRDALTDSMQKLSAQRMALEGQRTQADRDARDKNEALLNMERECSALERKKAAAAMEESQLLSKLWDSYELTYDSAQPQRQELESVARAGRRIAELKRSISALGNVNVGAIEEFRRISERYDYLTAQRDDVEKAKAELEEIIDGITEEMKRIFSEQFDLIADAFSVTFQELFGGGKAALELEDPEDILNCNIEIKVQPPGKALKVLSLLSGGEKAFVAIALYFAFLKVRPTPFVVMDEIEAALDDPNVTRFAHYVRSMSDKTQFIIITHRRGTMEEADVLYGVTMQERGISRVLTVNLNEVAEELNIQ
ncbi:MAG: chromosome segregation protein SMC, partial [Clostridiales bacterium]|nr:chromosome segregation protein SMC [Clostridiales bacterium]